MSIKALSLRQDLQALCDEDSMIQTVFQANLLAPPMPVINVSGNFPVVPRGTSIKLGDTRRNQDGSFNSSTYNLTTDSYTTEEFGWKERTDNVSKLINSQFFDEEVIAARIANNIILINREKRIADCFQDESEYGSDCIAATHEWNVAADGKPMTDILHLEDHFYAKTGLKRGRSELVMTQDLADYAMKTTELIQNAKYTVNLETFSEEAIANYLRLYFGVSKITIVSATYNTAGIGGAFTPSDLWNSEYVIMKLPSPTTNSWKEPSFARQPVYTAFSTDRKFESYIDEEIDSSIVRVREYRGLKMDYSWGVLLKDAVV